MEEHNPYASPNAAVSDHVARHVPGVGVAPLFRVSGIGLATIFGSVLAGGLLIALNDRALQRPERFWPTLGFALLAFAGIMLLAFVLPEQVPGIVFTIAQFAAATMAATRVQGDAINARIAAGLPMRSNWAAFGLALLVLIGIVALLAMGVMIYLWSAGITWNELLTDIA